MIDDGFMVSEAIPIDEAFAELRGVYQAIGLLPLDGPHPALAFYTSLAPVDADEAVREDWIARTVLAVLSEEALKRSLTSGQIMVWTADQSGERARDPRVLFAPSECDWHKTFATGRYIPVQGQPATPPSYVHARLWLKRDEWSTLRSWLLKSRGGGREFDTLMAAVDPSSELPATTATKLPHRGRPRGTGCDRSDAPLVDEIISLVRTGQVASHTEAAKRLADQASGHGTWESKVRRLQRAAGRRERNGG